ncbi:hypothetical protein G7046_g493 [Stylonectria norvegica]|nr:hypothetical protein G7046_g493 [Stylonectria norvegica]
MSTQPKPKILAVVCAEYAGKDYIEDFKAEYQLDVLNAKTREEAKLGIARRLAESGLYLAFMMLFGTRPYEPFDEELLAPLVPDCRLFVSSSAGYNEFDVQWMTKNGMWFCNTRDGVAEATADMTLYLILATLRDTSRAERSARENKWKRGWNPTCDPYGKTIGIVGMGQIGKYVARKVPVFNIKAQYYNRTRLPLEVEKEYNVTYCHSLKDLLQTSDIVSLHCPLNDSTTNLISAKEFAEMRDGTILINTARGPIVNEEALVAALKGGKVLRAGLDVFVDEPNINPWIRNSDLCTIQPHLAGLTDEAWKRSERECFENIRAFHKTGKPLTPVNKIP